MIGENPFTHESWERKDANEHEGEDTGGWEISVFEGIKKEAEQKPELRELLLDLEDSILRYGESVVKFDRSLTESSTKEDYGYADQSRKIVHDSLLDKINILSRAFANEGLDNSWRNVVGSDRNQIGQWALRVSVNLKNTILGEHGLE